MLFTPDYLLDRFAGVLSAQLLSSQTSGTFQINNASALASQLATMTSPFQCTVTIESEQILLSAFSVSGSTVTCTIASGGRGYNSTQAATHAADTAVEIHLPKGVMNNIITHGRRFDDDGMIVQFPGVVPTVTDANTLTFAGTDYTAYFTVGRVILYKISSTWYRATVRSSAFGTDTAVEITGDGLPGSGTITSIGFEMSISSHGAKVYDLIKQCSGAPAENPPSGYVWLYLQSGALKMKDSSGTVSTFATDLTVLPSGFITMYAANSEPSGWLLCNGQAVSRSTYAALLAVLMPYHSDFTVTIASPAVFTSNNHGLATGDSFYFTSSGSPPTGLTVNTRYWVIKIDANTFWAATSLANALAGTKINTSGSQSGTHSMRLCPYGLGDGSTTFNVPDLRQRFPVGKDQTDTDFAGLGQTGGAQSVTLTTNELPAHTHTVNGSVPVSGSGAAGQVRLHDASSTTSPTSATAAAASAGSGAAFSILNPYLAINFIIKT